MPVPTVPYNLLSPGLFTTQYTPHTTVHLSASLFSNINLDWYLVLYLASRLFPAQHRKHCSGLYILQSIRSTVMQHLYAQCYNGYLPKLVIVITLPQREHR